MVFMGSVKYPEENQYDAFISNHGGSCNACTEGEYTVYQFEIASRYFAKGLDLMANCFIAPLLSFTSADREINSIESEFNIARVNDGVRSQQLFCHDAQPGHVIGKFSWGNVASLKTAPLSAGVSIQEILVDFHKLHYVPSNQKMVVLAPKTLDALQADVVKSFGHWKKEGMETAEVEEGRKGGGGESSPAKSSSKKRSFAATVVVQPKKGKEKTKGKGKGGGAAAVAVAATSSVALLPLRDCLSGLQSVKPLRVDALGVVTRVVPVKNMHKLSLAFQLASQLSGYRAKSSSYVSHLVGHEGPGSLLSLLKSLNYATGVSAGISSGNFDENSMFSIFLITVNLTSVGVANWLDVAQKVFEYLEMLRRAGPVDWIEEEIRKMSQVCFDYLDEEDEEDFVERLAVDMQPLMGIDRHDLLASPFLHFEYNPASISYLLSEMVARNAKIDLTSAAFVGNATRKGKGKAEGKSMAEHEGEDEEDEEEGEGEWEDDEQGSEDEDEDEDPATGGGDLGAAEEGAVLSPEAIRSLYTGPPQWLYLVLPPDAATRAPLLEPHFGTEYWKDAIPEEIMEGWSTPEPSALLSLPPRNPFIPEDLSLVASSSSAATVSSPSSSSSPASIATASTAPSKVIDEPGLTAWHFVDSRFNTPKAAIIIRITSPVACASPLAAAMQELTCKLLRDGLNESLYLASMAELSCSIKTIDIGFQISISGFSDKIFTLAELVIKRLFDPANFLDSSAFGREAELLVRELRNVGLKASQSASSARLLSLKPSMHSAGSKLDALLGAKEAVVSSSSSSSSSSGSISSSSSSSVRITVNDLLSHVRLFLSCMCVDMLGQGNVSADRLIRFVEFFRASAATQSVSSSSSLTMMGKIEEEGRIALSAEAFPAQPILRISPNQPLVVFLPPQNPDESNVCVECYFQVGAFSIELAAKLDLLEQVLSEPFFDSLRTKQQLGYSVSCGMRNTFSVVGFCFQVVSSAYSVTQVQAAILAFASDVPKLVLKLSEADFDSHIESVRNSYLQPDATLEEAAASSWNEIEDRQFDFEKKHKLAAVVSGLSKSALAKFGADVLFPASRKLLCVQASFEGAPAPVIDPVTVGASVSASASAPMLPLLAFASPNQLHAHPSTSYFDSLC